MISNLFEEYKFFPKYPDKQLKIAAVLFGKHIFILIGVHKPFTVYMFSQARMELRKIAIRR
jgi:hypothetical protein